LIALLTSSRGQGAIPASQRDSQAWFPFNNDLARSIVYTF